jgi:ankyrin repeat protein
MVAAEEFFEAARCGDLTKLESMLEADPALAGQKNQLGQSAILLAKYHRQQPAVDFLLSRDPDLTLHEACAVGAMDAVKRLVRDRGRLIDTHSPDGFTPLTLACFFGHAEVAEHLVDQGANVNLAATNQMAVAPIHAASAARRVDLVRMLINSGADVNARQQQGFVPLHAAAQQGDEAMAKLLLDHGADLNAHCDSGQCALDFAMLQGHSAMVALLESTPPAKASVES